MNYYALLGVPNDADPDAIRHAFRALARQYHPDAGHESSADKFRDLVTAYETLIDRDRRRQYDRSLRGVAVPVARGVEPLRADPAPEPMVGPRRAVQTHRARVELSSWPFDLLDEIFRSWEKVVFGHRLDRL